MPCSSSRSRAFWAKADFLAAVRLMTRPAPWQVVPKLSLSEPAAPTSTYDDVPIEPGISTGWPSFL